MFDIQNNSVKFWFILAFYFDERTITWETH